MPKYVIVAEPVIHVIVEAANMKEAKRIAESADSMIDLENYCDETVEVDFSCDECLTYEYEGSKLQGDLD